VAVAGAAEPVAGAVGIGLVVVGGAVLGPWGDVPRHSSATSAPDPTSRADLVATLKGLLPKGRITEPNRLGAADSPYEAEVVYDDGEGPAAIGIAPGTNRSGPGSLMPRPS
jgi:hypothetical protein